MDRAAMVASVLGSTRAEGLEPNQETLDLLQRYADGEASEADLEEYKRKLVEEYKPI